MTPPKLQEKLFRRIRQMLPQEANIADVISENLHVSTDSAYRRIRGETPLVLEEAAILCARYNLSLDELMGNQNTVVFQNKRLDTTHSHFVHYLEDIQEQFNALEQFARKEVIYMSKDLPIFHNFYFKPLTAFRYYFWMKIQVQHPDFEKKLFSVEDLPDAVIKASETLLKSYTNVPSSEMWNMESINSTISQIEFSRNSGHFKNEDEPIVIYEALEQTILHIKEQAENGCKYLPGEDSSLQTQNLKFYFNRVVLGDNTIMAITNETKAAFINYGQLNYMMTNDETFCDLLYQDFENLRRRSTQISATSERQRHLFFNNLLSKIRERKQNIG